MVVFVAIGVYSVTIMVLARLLLRRMKVNITTHKIMSPTNATEPMTMPIICPVVRLLAVRSHDHRV